MSHIILSVLISSVYGGDMAERWQVGVVCDWQIYAEKDCGVKLVGTQ